jgi:hypothetical protein
VGEKISERCLSVVGRKVSRKGRVWNVREGEEALVPLRGNDKCGLEFGVGEGAAKRSEVFKRSG